MITLRANEEKTIKTPNYPNNSDYEKCTWLITAPDNYLVQIYFEEFEISSLGSVCAHNVEIRNNVLGQRGDM